MIVLLLIVIAGVLLFGRQNFALMCVALVFIAVYYLGGGDAKDHREAVVQHQDRAAVCESVPPSLCQHAESR